MTRPAVLPLTALVAMLLPLSAAGQASLSAEQLQAIKAATVFVKVQGGRAASTGSGFVVRVDGPVGYVVTNHHVIEQPERAERAEVEVVFDSGTPKERVVKAAVAAADPRADLAVLRVAGVKNLPAPLDVTDAPQVMETMPVYVCGFPFGGRLSVGEKNPEISIGTANVSSIRRNELGLVAAIELNGALNPGNSGGPIVSDKGKLVGVAVSTVRGAGIGRAVPREEVEFMLRGRVGLVRLVPGMAGKARLEVDVIDPLRRVKTIAAHYKPAGGELPAMKPDSLSVLPGATKLPLTLDTETMQASGEVSVPDPRKAELVVQVEMTLPDGTLLTVPGLVAASDPRAAMAGLSAGPRIRLPSGQVLPRPTFRRPPGSDDDALGDLIRNPAAFVGKAVAFDALSNCGVLPQGDKFELQIETDAERPPTNLRPVVPKDLALQLADLGIPDPIKFPVRLKGQVQKPAGRDDRHLIELTEVGFLNDAGTVETTLRPETAPPAGPPTLASLNRFPEKYVGQVVTVVGIVKGAKFAGRGLGVEVQNENQAAPLNLAFYTAKDLHNRLASEVPGEGAAANLTVTLDRVDAKTGQGIVGVTKVELLGVGPKPKAWTSSEKIAYPAAPAAAKPKASAATPPATAETPASPAPSTATPGGKGGGSSLAYILLGVAALAGVGGAAVFFLRRRKPATPGRYAAKPPARPEPGTQDANFPGFDFDKSE